MQSGAPTYKDLLDEVSTLLYDVSDTPRIDAEVLMQHVVSRPLAWLIAYGETVSTADHIKAFYDLASKRQSGYPISYLTGVRDFWTLTLKVDENVLIPRPDTETLVEQALNHLSSDSDLDPPELNILDLGTGSGAIALAMAKEKPAAKVLAVDAHQGALEVAVHNAKLNQIANVDFLNSNWFENVPEKPLFDLIASNPPYVEANDPHLERGDLRFEPDTALVAAKNGFADLASIIQQAPVYLKPAAWLIVEHGYNQADQVADLFRVNGFANIALHHDINDLPRCTSGQLAL